MKELKAIVDWVNLAEDVRELSLKFGDIELYVSRNRHTTGRVQEAPASTNGHHGAPPAPAPTAAAPSSPTKQAAPVPAAQNSAVTPAEGEPNAANDAGLLADNEVLITAPMLGTFYASPQPGAPAFVSIGDTVAPNSVLGIVEVMKLMNNIEAGVEGTVARVLVENESMVEYGQPLIVIRKTA
ncbi:acetyl-CoA carboxylase biotin carboxyl carrier protein [Arthrobacter oryzae]|uniref:acetyl-CoA carboxylase biotin carboxyl carrier protein n=1 Tax=Arthrobacter oryzae TaxID=409290 RepID=UPI0028622A17|nr:acetyl-CoA carboxylase biotin carboxyl carrier protein [Arthrobacter oryzae]MDR6507618.1 acetyl-CoA carboxylase biotin carboxyl carrier protein [Arthrobacter oryzae]